MRHGNDLHIETKIHKCEKCGFEVKELEYLGKNMGLCPRCQGTFSPMDIEGQNQKGNIMKWEDIPTRFQQLIQSQYKEYSDILLNREENLLPWHAWLIRQGYKPPAQKLITLGQKNQ